MAIYDIYGNSILADNSFNVRDFGAEGDGVTDDASAIQDALDACHADGGGVVYFPYGTYKITVPVLFYSNQTLFFENGATILQGANINSLMRNYSTTSIGGYDGTHDSQIIGATFDGGSYTTNNTLLGFCHSKNIAIKNCSFKNAYGKWHDLEINSSKYILVERCDFNGSRKNAQNGENLQFDGAGNASYYPWGDIKLDGTICQYIEIKGCHFHDNTASPAIGNHSDMAHKFIRIHDCVIDGNTGARGAINLVASVSNVDIYNNTLNGCTTGIGSSGETYYIYNNRFVDTTTAISGSTSIAHNNIINGTFTA